MKASMQNALINFCTNYYFVQNQKLYSFANTKPLNGTFGMLVHVTYQNQHIVLYFTVYPKKVSRKKYLQTSLR